MQTIATAAAILAIDLGKYKSVACVCLLGDDTRAATTNQETCRCSPERRPRTSS